VGNVKMPLLEDSQGRATVLLIRDQQHDGSDFGGPVPLIQDLCQ